MTSVFLETFSKTLFKTSIDLSTGTETTIILKSDIFSISSKELIIPNSLAAVIFSFEVSNPEISASGYKSLIS